MNDLAFYLKEGWDHIISKDALDHILFIIALIAIYNTKDWKNVLILITAFTIGHSITLALSVYNIIKIKEVWVEFLIPCTIIITSLYNFFQKNGATKKIQSNYFFAFSFGLIHGLGFANTIRFMLAKDQNFGVSLFGFNIGLEIGQIAIVTLLLLFNFISINLFKIKQQYWTYLLSTATLLWAVKFALERLP
jgi:uncharacterized membrane protein YfcA